MSKLYTLTATCLLMALAGALPAHAAGTLKVCADPDYLPYSNRAGQGFENAVAETVAKAMGAKLEYVWADMRGHGGFPEYLSRNLDSGKCDVVMSMPYGNDEELTTDPYYVSSYVFVFKKDKGYNIENMNSPDLRKLKLGFEGDTPVEAGLQLRGLVTSAKSFDISESSGESPRSTLDAVQNGQIDVMITWQPAIGAFLHDYPELTTLFFEFHGSPSHVEEQVGTVRELAEANGGGAFEWADRQEDRNRLWKARHEAFYATLNLRPGSIGWATDVCVPIGRLA